MRGDLDAGLLVAFGGPQGPEEVRPFIDEVLEGRPVPEKRREEVVSHYMRVGGRSPLVEHTQAQAHALERLLREEGHDIPIFVGMRYGSPRLRQAIGEMESRGIKRAAAVILAAHRSPASVAKYADAVSEALHKAGPGAPAIVYAPPWFDHPAFAEAAEARIREATAGLAPERLGDARLIFTAHSIPVAMAQGCSYVADIETSCRATADRLGRTKWSIAYQSRSGRPDEPWLEPDISDALRAAAEAGAREVIVSPIGFVCDHVEILYDLDIVAREEAKDHGINFIRAKTVMDHAAFIRVLADSVLASGKT